MLLQKSEKSNKENLKVIKNTLPNNLPRNPKSLLGFCVSSDQWKNTVAKISQRIWERILYENNRTIILTNLVPYSLLSLACLFVETKNKYQIFSNLVIWVWEISFFFLFIASRALLQRYANSIDFYKRIFVHVIPAGIVVPRIK